MLFVGEGGGVYYLLKTTGIAWRFTQSSGRPMHLVHFSVYFAKNSSEKFLNNFCLDKNNRYSVTSTKLFVNLCNLVRFGVHFQKNKLS